LIIGVNICGIAGFIGLSKDPSFSYEIITNLFKNTEIRGIDAAGFWGVNEKQDIIYHKEPIRSSDLVRKESWKAVKQFSPTLLLVHARAASLHVGTPEENTNNHPFTSTDRTLSLVHNGRIAEFDALKSKFNVASECDSEVLLRIIEAAPLRHKEKEIEKFTLSKEVAYRLAGIKDIYSLINDGHMAVAIGEILDNKKYLWIFRNIHRSLWLVDLRESLGQIFFCSTPEIWNQSISRCRNIYKHALLEVKPEEVWCFKYNKDIDVFHCKVNRHKEYTEFKKNSKVYPIQKREITNNIIGLINEETTKRNDYMSNKEIISEINVLYSSLNTINSTIYVKKNKNLLHETLYELREINHQIDRIKRNIFNNE